MSNDRDSIHCRLDPEQTWQPAGGEPVQEISIIMTDEPRFDRVRGRCWLPPALVTLTPEEARGFAAELLEFADLADLADQAERIGGER